MLGVGLQAHQVNDVDDAHLEFGEVLAEQRRRGEVSSVGTSPAQAITTSGSAPSSLTRPFPDADAAGAVQVASSMDSQSSAGCLPATMTLT